MQIRNKLYSGEVELLFESFRHQYTDKNGVVPSVTTVLGIIAKPALIQWAANMAVEYVAGAINAGQSYDELELSAIFEAGKKSHYQKKVDAGTLGTFVHKWVEQYIKGENPGAPINPGLQVAVDQFLKWVKDHKIEFLASEQMVYSKKFRYCGTFDFICKMDGELFLGDLKTSSGIYTEYMMQTAAYRYAREEEFATEKYAGQLIIRIGKDGDFEFAVMRGEEIYRKLFVGFLAALKLYETTEALKVYKPEKE